MPRLIDADALVDDGLRFQDGYDYDGIMMVRLGDVIKSIRNAPTIDAVPVVHGEWKPGKEISRTMLCNETLAIEYDAFYCSSCGRRYKEYVLIYSYCPNCGAKMDGGDNNG